MTTLNATVIDIGFTFRLYDDTDATKPTREAMFWIRQASIYEFIAMLIAFVLSTLNAILHLIIKPALLLYRLPVAGAIVLVRITRYIWNLPQMIMEGLAKEYLDCKVDKIYFTA